MGRSRSERGICTSMWSETISVRRMSVRRFTPGFTNAFSKKWEQITVQRSRCGFTSTTLPRSQVASHDSGHGRWNQRSHWSVRERLEAREPLCFDFTETATMTSPTII